MKKAYLTGDAAIISEGEGEGMVCDEDAIETVMSGDLEAADMGLLKGTSMRNAVEPTYICI